MIDKQKALDLALAQIEKQFGKGSIMRLGEASARLTVEVIPTGSIALDMALGVGGIPRGRITEVFGPESSGKTTVALHTVAEAQKAGGVAAFIDAEHALDPGYARVLGVDVENLLISQPDTGEQALEIAEALVRSGAVDIVVVDSVAALVPRAEIEGEMGDAHVGLQARLMSQALRKLTGAISKSRTALVFINQMREKIGVMFGCLHYRSRVRLADGSTEWIGKLVNNRIPTTVLSYDPVQGKIIPRRVVNWFKNGRTDKFLQIISYYPGGNGRAQVSCTEDHPILTPRGWRRASKLRVGDPVMVAVKHRLSEQQWEIVRSSLLGDGALSPVKVKGRGIRFRMGHGCEQVAYLDWKANFFRNIPHTTWLSRKGAKFFDTTPLPELYPLWGEMYRGGKKHLNDSFLSALTPISLAIWVMDDANLSLEAIDPDSRERLVECLARRFGVQVVLAFRGKARNAGLNFTQEATARLSEIIAPYVPPCMEHKLLPEHRGRYQELAPQWVETELRPMAVPVLDIHEKPLAKTRGRHRFDIEVEGSHNFLADHIIVHNSPETTPGGRALKFYASIRIDVRRVDSLKQGAENVGIRIRAKVVKNKLAAPFRQAEFDLLYSSGISREGDLLDIAAELGLVTRVGAWYSYGDERLGQGRENARDYLRQHPEVAATLEQQIRGGERPQG